MYRPLKSVSTYIGIFLLIISPVLISGTSKQQAQFFNRGVFDSTVVNAVHPLPATALAPTASVPPINGLISEQMRCTTA